ncbi:mitochondrial ribosomal protein subunit L20-domain-containing protein [Pseudomassariella vexata]|uniref:Mitochondrial ribosomal protein subunit L20-domain-containing protein n=1 Tax=Pseudomassariella vexata TaxID=1141098 RepID=A0A1Y2E239_9PEZI|nr:mitochondrial ribosomal protein subunit L20-domain-containing protein [Pseudomassariella vexata]ORY65386.1 mitochondrial ribosomal protein subunit L20-domain-containing protein [Pseudomassariella vexata]
MEARQILRPFCSLTSTVIRTTRRCQSTTSRTKKALKIRPDVSFLTPNSEDHIIFNPPSSAPSVYHTPFKFLPKSDPRRQANLTHLLRTSDLHNAPLPPPAGKLAEIKPRSNVTKEEVEEMRQLRNENPAKWSVVRLAEKFQCTKLFVMMCCQASDEHWKSERERLEAIKARWGPMRTNAREERQKRKKMLARGEL